MINLSEEMKNVKSVAISGHIRPDGDCLGSTLGLRNYIIDNCPGVFVSVYLLMPIPLDFDFLRGYDEIKTEYDGEEFDLFIACDCGAEDRLDKNAVLIKHAKRVLCIDHHEISRTPVPYDESYIDPPASSTCELVYNLLDVDKISKSTAECLYTGIVHDTGKFQFQCCHRSTMEAAGVLMEKGIDYSRIIDETFNFKTFTQIKLLGYAIDKAELALDGQMIVSVLTLSDFEKFGANSKDTEGIVQRLRET